MSGVAGADRVKSRQDFQQFLKSYKDLISQFPGFVGFNPSGSYNSNLEKNDFGDIDLIVHIQSNKDKAAVKKELQAFLQGQPETVIVPFSSAKHTGKRSYNAGELVSVRYHDNSLGYSAQIDNIVALDHKEAGFKQQFLDWPAEKQGLILGLVKIAAIETDFRVLFKKLGIKDPGPVEQGQEYEFNLSSVELQLRRITYKPGTYEQVNREVLWNSKNFEDIQKLLYQYDLNADFDSLLAQCKQVIKNPRSYQRMQGVFSSMITVKSGEVGTPKGAGKEAALAKVQQTFKESRSILRTLTETSAPSTVVFAFGRLQPPTIGHELLVNAVKQTAEQNHCPYVIYVSRTVGKLPAEKLKNPLTVDQKMGYLTRMFPGTNFQPATDIIRTPIEAAKHLNQKYRNIIMIAGGSRAEEFEKVLNDYNGKDYNFDSIRVVKIDRDPDADDASGISGTKMRQAAAADDFETFKSGVPGSLDDATAQQLMADVKAGMTPTPKVKKTKETMMPASNFAGSKKNKLGPAGQWNQSKHRPARAGDFVGGEGMSQLRRDQDNLSELMNTKPAKSNQAKWRGDDNLANLNFVASNGIPYQLSIMGFHAAPDEVQPYDFDTFDNADGDPDLGRFIEFIQEPKPGVGYGKQGIEGTGAAAEIFGIVYNAIAQYVKKHKLTFVMFQAAEPSRRKLYTALTRKMLQTFPGWKYEEQDGVYFVYNSKFFPQQQKSDDDADIAEIFGLKTKPEPAKPKKLTPDDYAELMKMSKQQKPIGPTANKKVYHNPDEYDWEKKHGLAEANSLEGTVKTIADHGKYIAQVFEQLKAMAKRYVDGRGDLKGFAMVAGGVGSRWFNDFYFNKLQAELYALTKQAPKHSQALIYFLKDASEDREHKISFNEISKQLPTILFNMGHKMKSGALTQFADNWGNRYHEYKNYLSKIEIEAGYDNDDFDEPKVKAPKSDTMGKQNAQVDQIVSGVLAKLPKKVAGDIRNAIARSDNKLQALHQELKKRDIQGVAEDLGKQIHGIFQSMGDSYSDAHLAKGISYFLQGRHQEGENWLRGKIPEKAQHAVFSKLKTLQAQSGLDVNKNPNIQKYIDDKLVPWVKSQIQQGVAEGNKVDFNNIGENWELAKAEAIARLIESQLK